MDKGVSNVRTANNSVVNAVPRAQTDEEEGSAPPMTYSVASAGPRRVMNDDEFAEEILLLTSDPLEDLKKVNNDGLFIESEDKIDAAPESPTVATSAGVQPDPLSRQTTNAESMDPITTAIAVQANEQDALFDVSQQIRELRTLAEARRQPQRGSTNSRISSLTNRDTEEAIRTSSGATSTTYDASTEMSPQQQDIHDTTDYPDEGGKTTIVNNNHQQQKPGAVQNAESKRYRLIAVYGVAIMLIILGGAIGATVAITRNGYGGNGGYQTSHRPISSPQELTTSIDAYVEDGTPDSSVAKEFGYPIGIWDVSGISDFSRMFSASRNQAMATFNSDLSEWDVSNAVSMEEMFEGAASFDRDLRYWDVHRVTNMKRMFADATSFNGRIDEWDVSQCEDFSGMFEGASSFDQDLCQWAESIQAGASTSDMFADTGCPVDGDVVVQVGGAIPALCNSCLDTAAPTPAPPTAAPTPAPKLQFTSSSELRQAVDDYLSDNSNDTTVAATYGHPIGSWDVSAVSDFSNLFNALVRNSLAASFDEPLDAWNMSQALDLTAMFSGASKFNQNLSSWDVSGVTKMYGLFDSAVRFNGDVSTWNTGSVTDMSFIFSAATSFAGDISAWDVSNVELMTASFQSATSFDGDLSGWDVSNVVDMSYAFFGTSSFTGHSISGWNTGNVAKFVSTFNGATVFEGDITAWDVSSAQDISVMFGYSKLFNQNLSAWDVSRVTNFSWAFGSTLAFDGDISMWNTSSGLYMSGMFYRASKFNQSISEWDVSNVRNMDYMFKEAPVFNGDVSGWNVSSVTSMVEMFDFASTFGQDLCAWGTLLYNKSVELTNMFYLTNCEDQSDPDLIANPPGPFCYVCA